MGYTQLKRLLVAAALAIVFLQMAPPGHAQKYGADVTYSTEEIGEGLYTFLHGGHRNIFLVTDEGVIATDPLMVEAAAILRDEIAKVTDQPVRYVAYSHSHWDHAAGGKIFKDEGAQFVAQEKCLENMKLTPHRDVVPPDITFSDTYKIELGDSALELFYFGPSHDNCLVVMIARPANLLFVVDIASPPTGWYMEWDATMADTHLYNLVPVLKAIEDLAELEGIKNFVGGHLSLGFDEAGEPFAHSAVGPVSAIREKREFWEAIMGPVRMAMNNGMLLEDVPNEIDRSPFADRIEGYNDEQMSILLRRVGAYVESGR